MPTIGGITSGKGTRGDPGVAGSPGFDGEDGIDGVSIPGVRGDKGLTGSQGITGPIGVPGDSGEDGLDGISILGPQGPQGVQGIQGPAGSSTASPGPMGPMGFDGEDGENAISIPGPVGPAGSGGGGKINYYATSIPRMTSDITPSGIASASENYVLTPPWQSMATPGLYNGWITNGSVLPQWLKYKYSGAKTAIAYGFRPWWADTYPTRTPTAWTFQGSNDNSAWTTLDTRSGFTPSSPSIDFVFAVASPAPYLYYRLNISANGGDTYTGVGEFLIFTSEDPISGGVLVQRNDLSAAIAT